MSALAWLIPAALLLGLLGLAGFLWSLRSGQFDDLEGAAYRILDDEEDRPGGNGLDRDRAERQKDRAG
jgi:cbb3-type cytochrome oxidase maturation protein